ncbi:GNAT family N-acetyltransferase [Nonlabens mediterrranea]|uniref:GNAT family N-acetyltransferase n=1 Tax=Nonlabens mediterrranea TaxID=1419947 RepID=A0ABS0A936_9FLAO|nr:GNAT family N-acetyltransferase [Nonlabens mediterrranea]
MMNLEIRNISGIETYPVRHPVLRSGRPITDCYFEGDDLDTTFHLGIFREERLHGVATFLMNKDLNIEELISLEHQQCYQLRGMAIKAETQGQQLGSQLIDHAEEILKNKNVLALWFNARESAVSFYKKKGYQIVSEPFEIATVGIHYKMYKAL